MTEGKKANGKSPADLIVENLFNYAIDRKDLKIVMSRLPDKESIQRNRLEYELQLIKIIAVGWSISYYLEASPLKNELTSGFWQAVREFSQNLSKTTGMMIGNEIDYFKTLKERLDHYVHAMQQAPTVTDPAIIIGPEFAGLCGDKEDPHAVMAGSRMFIAAIGGVRKYLEELKLGTRQ